MSKIIEVTQKPIIAYNLIKKVSNDVEAKIQSLNIDTLEPTEENLKAIKSTRAELNNEFKTLEEQRKMVKEIVLKDYNEFEAQYKTLIANKFKDADVKLKGLADTVDDKILSLKIVGIKDYFDDVNKIDFLSFYDLGLKIIKSKSDKIIKTEIDNILLDIENSIITINTMQNKDRILAKFQMHKDLNRAISETNLEVEREANIKKQNEERAEREAEQRRLQKAPNPEYVEPVQEVKETVIEEPKTFKTSFTVYGSREQFAELKQFMNNKGIRYEK